MYSYLETLPQWLETIAVMIVLILLLLVVIASIIFTYRIIKKIKDIKLEAAGAKIDIQIEAPTTDAEELKPAELK
jgi:uncharacterized protein (UPF0333 family)